ncbi:hypothetical protein COT65_00220 [Candidatus Shapirobacteria bacterium CG09_land_8_20_14_0_10_47_13]|uniref:Uncharacterized protein n=1 Tax=Candidatus Shapirobacteria bacterium CG09_land_8_20_14_0_10_47_13 TaxID=1974481 RepID=A0A2H0WNJ8_9BACT|nr:MAG: hypothetical protein COT65_00220 [Candidatus Shapirobacteria bacterium CG09_land_8_20_14_0_10_47_13]
MSLSQKVALNTIVQVAAKIITVLTTLITTILLTGYLGKEGYGDYIFVITLAILFGSLADWGTATIGVREVSKNKDQSPQWLANLFILRLGLSLAAAVLLMLVSWVMPLPTKDPQPLRQVIQMAGLIVFLVATKASFLIVFQVKLQMYKAALVDIFGSLLILLFSWLAIQKGLGLAPLVWAVIGAGFVSALAAAALAFKTVKYIFVFDAGMVRKIISESLPMGAILMLFTIDNKIDTVMLGMMKGSGPVGIYGIAYRVYDVLILGAAYLMNALLPVISQYSDLGKWSGKLRQIYQQSFDILLLGGAVILVVIWAAAPLIVRILTQQKFNDFGDAVPVLRILTLAMFISYFNHLTGYTIVALGKQRPYFWVAGGALVFNVALNLLVIPRFSYFGAAWVTVLSEGLVLMITTFFIFRILKIIPSIFEFPKTALQIIKGKGKIF